MLPVFALVGRPNVGKSTLFNRLTRSRDAIVHDLPGVTRDRLYGKCRRGDKSFLAVDTGGIAFDLGEFDAPIRRQVETAVDEADGIVLLVDARAGLTPADHSIAMQLRRSGAPVWVAVNKSEQLETELAVAEFQELGFGPPVAISAREGDGVAELTQAMLRDYPAVEPVADDEIPTIALAGRPNVGKSTLANKLAKSARVVVGATPGTTRDSVSIPLRFAGRDLALIDTAGVRRKARVDGALEKFSVVKTLQAMAAANVVVLVLDAAGEIGAQDAAIAGMIADLGRALVVAVNKWDCLDNYRRGQIRAELARKLPFLPDCEKLFISALRGMNVGAVLPAAVRAYAAAYADIATSSLNQTLAAAVAQTPPPRVHGHAARLKFAHQAGKNPPVIVVHGSRVENLPPNYRRYLARFFARKYRLQGTPIRIVLRSAANPFAPN